MLGRKKKDKKPEKAKAPSKPPPPPPPAAPVLTGRAKVAHLLSRALVLLGGNAPGVRPLLTEALAELRKE